MASLIAKFVGKKILGETIQNKFGKEDPYFEQVPATRLDGRPSTSGKTKKRKKALPPGISEHDGQVLTKVKRRAYRLDMCLASFMGIRFGWGSVIGIIPVAGDFLDLFMSLMVLKSCTKIDGGLPNALKVKMILNIIFDFIIGLVPFLGDLADAAFRANTKNVILLEEHLRQKGKLQLRENGLAIPEIDPSEAGEYDRWMDSAEDHSRRPSREPPSRSASHRQAAPPQRSSSHRQNGPPQRSSSRRHDGPPQPARPEPAEVRSGGGWFSRSRAPPHDVEMGGSGNERQSRRQSHREKRDNRDRR